MGEGTWTDGSTVSLSIRLWYEEAFKRKTGIPSGGDAVTGSEPATLKKPAPGAVIYVVCQF
jgi:hypothetical protein